MQWIPLFEASFIAILVLYIPGAFVLRSCKFSISSSLIIGPVITGFIFFFITVVAQLVDIRLTGKRLIFAAVILALLVLCISILVQYIKSKRQLNPQHGNVSLERRELIGKSYLIEEVFPDTKRTWLTIALYVLIAFIVSCFVFLGGIENPDTFSREFDAGFHYSAIRAFLNNGISSSLNITIFPETDAVGSFYPALYHTVVATVASITNINVPICFNAVVFTTLVMILPLGLFGVLSWIFKRNYLVIVFGSIISLAFAGYPWGNLIFGQIVPNFFSNALMLETILLFMISLRTFQYKSFGTAAPIFFIASVIALAITQPNAVFTAGIFCVFYLLHFLLKQISLSEKIQNKVLMNFIVIVGIILGSCALWAVALKVPLIQQISGYNEFITYETKIAIEKSLMLSFSSRLYPQIILALVCWIGFVKSVMTKGYRWMSFPFLISLFIYIVSASSIGAFCHMVSGFWYNDIYRTAAMVCIFGMPLAALGISVIANGSAIIINKIVRNSHVAKIFETIVSVILGFAFLILNFFGPLIYSPLKEESINAFEEINYFFHRWYSWDTNYLFKGDQYKFIQDAEKVITKDPGMLMNVPYDGSGWIYGTDGLNTMYRAGYLADSSPYDDAYLRENLDKYATSKKIQKAVKKLGIKYVLRITSRDPEVEPLQMMGNYDPEQWKGVENITDDTPGFEPVLKEGDMRLYKLKDVSELNSK